MDLGVLLVESNAFLTNLAILIGRVFIGVCFITHALGKLGVVGPGNMQGFVEWLQSLGVPMAPIQARVAMLSELIGGSLLTVGLFTRPACALLIGTMIVAGRIGHRGGGYLITNEPQGAEYPINLAAICLLFAILGPGLVSLDALVF